MRSDATARPRIKPTISRSLSTFRRQLFQQSYPDVVLQVYCVDTLSGASGGSQWGHWTILLIDWLSNQPGGRLPLPGSKTTDYGYLPSSTASLPWASTWWQRHMVWITWPMLLCSSARPRIKPMSSRLRVGRHHATNLRDIMKVKGQGQMSPKYKSLVVFTITRIHCITAELHQFMINNFSVFAQTHPPNSHPHTPIHIHRGSERERQTDRLLSHEQTPVGD